MNRHRFFYFLLLSAFLFFQTLGNASLSAEERAPKVNDLDARIRELAGENRRGGIVLVLSGGGTKGFAHIGVLKILERENIPVVGIVGTSIGSVIGGLYATGYSADEIHDLVMGTNIMGLLADSGTRIRPGAGDHRPVGESVKLYRANFTKEFKSAGPLGLLPAMSLVSFLTKSTGHIQTTDFNKLPIPFACVATDIATGDAVVLRDGNLPSSIRASVAIPGLLEPWPLDGRLLVDGGLVANLPVEIAKDIFPGYPVLAVNLSGESITKNSEDFTSIVDILMQTIDVMTIDRLKKNEEMADLVLYPNLKGFSMLDAKGYETIYQRGLEVAEGNVEQIIAISESAPPPNAGRDIAPSNRTVRSVRLEGLNERTARDFVAYYKGWIGHRYDINKVNQAMELLLKREEVATVDVETLPIVNGDSEDVEILFIVEKRAPFEITFDGYTTNLHNRRWAALMLNARDLATDGDAASIEGRLGNDEWGVALRYFTPLYNQGQWGFALNAHREHSDLYGLPGYDLNRYSLRALYYDEKLHRRWGIGVAAERTDAWRQDSLEWGPYLYFNSDTLDNALMPTSGYSINSQIWWNTADILVSQTLLTGYIPLKSNIHFAAKFGLKTGDRDHQAYRAILGNREELFSLARNPLYGDQAAWAHVGFGYNFYTSWWGALRGEVFGAYGMVLDNWDKTNDAWEAGIALTVPGQSLNGRVLLIYDDHGEFTLGFTLGIPRWWNTGMP